MKAGNVFRFVGIAEKHVWMIISDPDIDAEKVLMVNFTTYAPNLDDACIVERNEHPFIQHKTIINYARARIVQNAALDKLHAAGRLEFLESLSPALLRKIRECAMNSSTIPLELADILTEQELVD